VSLLFGLPIRFGGRANKPFFGPETRNDFYRSTNDREVIGETQISRKKKFVGEAIEALARTVRAERRTLPRRHCD
jgi:hypothetical protein